MFPRPQTARLASILPWILPTLLPGGAAAQGAGNPDVVEAYFRALGEHFRVSPAELEVLAAWGLSPEHLAVALFVARCSGGSPEAVIVARAPRLATGSRPTSARPVRAGPLRPSAHTLAPPR